MEDRLLAEILAAERGIRLQVESFEQQTAERLALLQQDLDLMLADEAAALQAELVTARGRTEQSAGEEAEALLAGARAYALRLENLDDRQLDRLIGSYLGRIRPEGAHDRQDEQA